MQDRQRAHENGERLGWRRTAHCPHAVRLSGAGQISRPSKSIYEEGETLFGSAERDALVDMALTLGAQPEFGPQPPIVSYGLSLTRFNRIEGLSTGIAVDQVLGAGYTAKALFRIGYADLAPNGELALERTDGRRTVSVGAYRRLAASNDWGDPLGFSSSISALLFGRDEGFDYRTWGGELKGNDHDGIIRSWRLFGEQHTDAHVKSEFSVAHPSGPKNPLTNIDAVNGTIVGIAVGHNSSYGLNPHGFRALDRREIRGSSGHVRLRARLVPDDAFTRPRPRPRWSAHARRRYVGRRAADSETVFHRRRSDGARSARGCGDR